MRPPDHQISLPHFSVPPLTPPDFFSTCPGATPWRHQISLLRVLVPPLDVTGYNFSTHKLSNVTNLHVQIMCIFCRRVHLLCVLHAPNFGFNLLLSLVHVMCCFVVVIYCCHLSFVVAIRICYCLRHFRLSTLFVFVCTCVRTGMCVAGGFQSH